MCEAVALHDFDGTDAGDLPFKKGTILKVFGPAQSKGWLRAEMDGKDGTIPSNYVQLKENEFMAPGVTRQGAEEELLKNNDYDGAFLIRESESTPGDYTVSVKYGESVQHFKVLRDGAGKYFLWVVKFNSLNQLVDYHRTSSVSRTQTIYLKDRSKSSAVLHVEAAYEFAGQEDGEISFKKGDRIKVTDKSDSNWWRGILVGTGKEGMFPVPYVKEITK